MLHLAVQGRDGLETEKHKLDLRFFKRLLYICIIDRPCWRTGRYRGKGVVSGKNHRLVDIKTLLKELRQGQSLGTQEACGIKKSCGTARKHAVEQVPMPAAERRGDRL